MCVCVLSMRVWDGCFFKDYFSITEKIISKGLQQVRQLRLKGLRWFVFCCRYGKPGQHLYLCVFVHAALEITFNPEFRARTAKRARQLQAECVVSVFLTTKQALPSSWPQNRCNKRSKTAIRRSNACPCWAFKFSSACQTRKTTSSWMRSVYPACIILVTCQNIQRTVERQKHKYT